MRTASTILATISYIAAWTTVAEAQAVERGVLLAVAADIAQLPGKLLGIGPVADSAKKRMPHLILVDTSIACSKGPGRCSAFGLAETMSLFRDVAERMNAKLNTGSDSPRPSNYSYYRFSEVAVRGDTAEVSVFMGWTSWAAPKSGHMAAALYVLVREPPETWRVIWKDHPSKREP